MGQAYLPRYFSIVVKEYYQGGCPQVFAAVAARIDRGETRGICAIIVTKA